MRHLEQTARNTCGLVTIGLIQGDLLRTKVNGIDDEHDDILDTTYGSIVMLDVSGDVMAKCHEGNSELGNTDEVKCDTYCGFEETTC